ncbi:MAG: hypothetical protein IJD68_07580 [Ruminococcus sp.]|nr:hypothetical protein [Ruminococcus sp.]MBQ4129615.1 hypothetical protein [Ruminococcus sp.]
MKTNKIDIIQESGLLQILRNGELEKSYGFNRIVKLIKEEKIDAVWLANFVAEIMHGCLNCKSASAKLKDLNGRCQFSPDPTYFEMIDQFDD